MATVAFFRAHPDDECMLTGGTMAKLAAAGHRVVLVTATHGERGEVPDGMLAAGGDGLPDIDLSEFGVTSDRITTRFDVSEHVGAKRQAMVCHASQIADTSWALALSAERFARAFGEEQYIRRGAPPRNAETDLLLR